MADFVATAQTIDVLGAAATAAAKAMNDAGDAADKVTGSVTKAGPSADSLVKRFADGGREAAAYAAALRQLQAATATMDAAVASGTKTADQRNQVVDALTQKTLAAKQAMNDAVPASNAISKAHTLAAGAATVASEAHAGFTRELVIMGHEVVTGNFSRIPGSMMVLAERSGNLNTIFSTLKGLVLGWPGMFAAAAGAMAFVGYEAESQARQLNTLSAQLSATRSDYMAMAAEANAAARAVAAPLGLDMTDARTASHTIAAVPAFQGSQIQLESLLRTAGDLARVMGQTVPEAAQTLAKAMQDPGKAADDLANTHFRGMSQALADAIKLQADAGDKAGAFAKVLGVVHSTAGGMVDHGLTPMQTALRDLSAAFTSTGKDGQTFAGSIGTAITDAAATAIEGLAGIVKAFDHAREHLAAGSLPGGPANAFNPSAGVPPPPGTGGVLLGSPVTHMVHGQSVTEQAMGIMQVLPSTGQGLGFSTDQLSTPGGNIQAGMAVLQQNYLQSGGSIPGALSRYGGYGTNTSAASGYIAGVQGQNTANLPRTMADAVQYWGNYYHLPPEWITLGQQLALHESRGQQFGNVPASVAATPQPMIPGVNDNLPLPAFNVAANGGVANSDLLNQAQKAADGMGLTAKTAAEADANVKLFTAALDDLRTHGQTNTAQFSLFSQALDKAQRALYDAVPAVQNTVREVDRQVSQNEALAAAYGQGYAAVQQITAANQAQAQALADHLIPNTDQFRAAVTLLTAENVKLAQAQAEVKIAQDTAKNSDQITLIQAETSSLGMNNDQRAIMLAHLQAELTLKQNNIPEESKLGQAYLQSAEALARATSELQRQQNALSEFGNFVDQTFNTIGQSISNAFFGGTGAAVNFGNVARSVLSSVANEVIKLAVINPIMNSVLGANRTTASDVLGVIGSGAAGGGSSSGGSSLLSDGQNLLQGVGLLDKLGITNFGDSLGLTGSKGLFSGVSNFLATPVLGADGLFGGASIASSAASLTPAGAGLGAFDAAGVGAASAAGPSVSLGALAGGVGAGFGLGSLAGGFVQSSLGKTGPGPEIGAGGGAIAGAAIGSIFPVIGTLLGAIIGGLVGGAGGGLIGPKPPSPFSSTGISIDNGNLAVGKTVAQIDDASGERTDTINVANALNTILNQNGITLTSIGGASQIGQNSPKGPQDPSKFATANAAFSGFQFSANDPVLNDNLSGKSFASLDDFAAEVQKINVFVHQTVPTLESFTTNTGSLQKQVDQITGQFADAIATAHELNYAEADLTAVRDKAVQAARDAATNAAQDQTNVYAIRGALDAAQLSGSPADLLAAQLWQFDRNAWAEKTQLDASLTATFGDSYRTTAAYADEMGQLENALGKERLSIQQQYNDKLAQAAQGPIQSLSSYIDKLTTGPLSALSSQDQLALTQGKFTDTANLAAKGDITSITNLPTVSDAFLSAARTVFGSGQGFADDFRTVMNALQGAGSATPDMLTASVLQTETRTQTQVLSDAIAEVRDQLVRLNAQMVQNGLAPARIAA